MKSKLLSRAAIFTDIHFGKKANQKTHNEDCLAFIQWFCERVKEDGKIDHILFLGDWNENRSALNVETLNYSYRGAKLLNSLNMPVYFVIGNHDLYHKHTREIHSVVPFNEFKNFIVVQEPLVVDEVKNKMLICPYLFHEEYKELKKHLKIPFWAGHFEFKGFEVTGYGMKMPTGPEPDDFKGPRAILSGHFHKRQQSGNIIYIGNAFPMDFGDAGDNDRGMTIYDHEKENIEFINWEDCPKYLKFNLSDLLAKKVKLENGSRVKCIMDVPLDFEEGSFLKEKMSTKYNLKDFVIEESYALHQALTETEVELDNNGTMSIDDLVIHMLHEIDDKTIDNNTLIEIYNKLVIKE